MSRTEALLLMAAEGLVGALLTGSAWLAPGIGPSGALALTAVVLGFLFFVWAMTWAGSR